MFIRKSEKSEPGTPSIDQLKVFLTVVETGSFAAAGRRVGRATSAISYAIANLELQLGILLFDRKQTRKPILTEAGGVVLSEARTLSLNIDHLRARVKGLRDGLEAEMALAVDAMLPTDRLVDALQTFETAFPTVVLRLRVEALGAITHLVLTGAADVGVSGSAHGVVPGIEQIEIGGVELIAVAAPGHPLARNRPNQTGAARDHVQLVLSDRSSLTEGRDFGVLGARTWRLADLGSKKALLCAGIGWGHMPEPMVREDLAAGRLQRLEIPESRGTFYPLHAIHRSETPPKPAAAWMIRRLLGQMR